MKKLLLVAFVAFFAAMASVNAKTVGHTVPSDPRFLPTYNQALILNEDRFADLDKIQIGDTVYFPARAGAGVEYWIAEYPNYGVHDCIWRLTGKYLAGQLPTITVDTPKVVMEPVYLPIVPEKNTDWDLWLLIILIGIAVIAIVAYLFNRFRPWNNRRDINHNPVVPGGLSNDPTIAANQIGRSYPNQSPAVSVTRGVLISEDGSPARVTMQFSDGQRTVTLNSGETAYQVIRQNGDVDYYRQHCGNLVGEVSNGRLTLPEGWRFEALATPAAPVVSAPVTTNVNTPAADAKSEEKKVSDFEGLSKVLEVAGAMVNAPVKITFGDLVVEFQPVKEENKDK